MSWPVARVARPAAVLAAITMLASCAIGPSDRPPVAVRNAPLPPAPGTTAPPGELPLPPLNPPGQPRISFTDCTDAITSDLGDLATRDELTYECGQLGVPASPDEPARRRTGVVQLAMVKIGTGVPLVVVGDAAGEPGRLLAARLANQAPPELLDSFAIIGVDRRGTGRSQPVDCAPASTRERMLSIDPHHDDAVGDMLDAASDASHRCVQVIDEWLTMVDSWRAASDLEQIRRELAADYLHALAVGDGSHVLIAYAEQFPNTVGRTVLDGAPDPALDAIGIAQVRAQAAERALEAFVADCSATPTCPLGADPEEAITDLFTQLRDQPEIASDGALRITAGTLYSALLVGIADQQRWPELADALADAADGDVEGIADLIAPLVRPNNDDPPRLDGAMLTTCNDTTTRVPPNRAVQLVADWREESPTFGALHALRLVMCSPSPVPKRTVSTPRSAELPPIMVLGSAGDPVTPMSGSQRMAEALNQGMLVAWQGYGHGTFPRSSCVTRAVTGYLVDGELARSRSVCPP